MKLKYYLNNWFIMIIFVFLITFVLVYNVNAYTLDSSSAIPGKIYKCQPSTVYANFSDFTGITGVSVLIDNKFPAMINGTSLMPREVYAMSTTGGGQWTYVYGNNASIVWGNKSIRFNVSTAGGSVVESTGSSVFVYSDDCVGTGITNVSVGAGNYTSRLQLDDANLLTWMIRPFVDYWGQIFYILCVLAIVMTIYIKSQHVGSPLLVGTGLLALLGAYQLLPADWKIWIMVIMAAAIVTILWKVFKK